ncbi:phosphoadenylyl-sulfate reductase [Corynebacterium tapiri]|uniref:Adenosine 5'-phosphosulfate reductase n=1 Tax=Corynebacterium tapiri TaxID=1448266 RepID=A0A5C4U3F2_9CORY|nr:phosphoadenylyl-sulfate reductase [Corynebacterium tapiri]TNL95698.1 phosphoadenylyl-sulfate reductase [Corynebacterium tapiri]
MASNFSLLNPSSDENEPKRDPELSPPGDATTAQPLDDETLERNRQLVERYADELYDAPAERIFEWTKQHAPGPVVITMSMENTVLAELAKDHLPGADLLFLDTEYHFPETLEVARDVEKRYPDNHLLRVTATLSREEQDEVYGKNLYRSNPTACCRMRKVEPLQRALSPYVGVIDGLRRADGPTRAQAPALSLNKTGRLKISPIITWSLEDTEAFIAERDLIVHPLTRQGYPSIGCATCTLPVAEGQDPRAGRWAGSAKTECGLHT